MNVTLVAYYGAKPTALAALLERCSQMLQQSFGEAFLPYAPGQIHGTVIGMEAVQAADTLLNRNFLELRDERRPIVFERLLSQLRDLPPFVVQLGGFLPEQEYGFTSRGQHPFLRSFSLGRGGAVLMGWARHDVVYPDTFDQLRRSFQSAGVLHKYHANPQDRDNDFYLVLGKLDPLPTTAELEIASQTLRELLVQHSLDIPLGAEQLAFVAYDDPRLTPGQCDVLKLTDATPERLRALYLR